jgi:hypothetical protein
LSFVFIVAGRNNDRDVVKCLNSLLLQHYPLQSKCRLLYCDDASDNDNQCFRLVKEWIRKHGHRFKQTVVVQNVDNRGAAFSRHRLLTDFCNSNNNSDQKYEVVLVDGDDCLLDVAVLSHLEDIYTTTSTESDDVWLTYGGYRSNDNTRKDWGNWTDVQLSSPGGIRASKLFYASHLRTFRTKLYHSCIRVDDLQDAKGDWLRCSTDVAIMIPLIESAGGKTHCRYCSDRQMYSYTIHEGEQYALDRVQQQVANKMYIYSKQHRQPLASLEINEFT